MRAFVFLALASWLALSNVASAQVREGDVRLFLDSSFLRWTSARAKAETRIGDRDYKEHQNTLEVDLLGRGGVGIGYVASRWIVPELYFSLSHTKTKTETQLEGMRPQTRQGTGRRWELRPMLEIPLAPYSRAVPFLAAGFSLERQVRDPYNDDTSRFAYGPFLGLGLHGFVRPATSLDVTLGFRGLFVKDEQHENELEAQGLDDVRQRQIDLMLTVGTSFWL